MLTTISQQKSIQLQQPVFQQSNFKNIIPRTLNYRKGGAKFGHQLLGNKHVFHNYGYGGAELSLAYGASMLITKQLNRFCLPEIKGQIAVIGCGFIGLLTAIELSKKGHKVTIYTSKIPKRGASTVQTRLGSQFDNGLWMPGNYDNKDRVFHQALCKYSYSYLSECLKSKRYQAVSLIDVYERNNSIEQIYKTIPKFILSTKYQNLNVNFGGVNQSYIQYQTFKINPELFLEELRTQSVLRGIKIVERTLQNRNQIENLKEQFVFNCSGSAAKYLFDDDNIVEIPNNMLIVECDPTLNYSITAKHNGQDIKVHCSKGLAYIQMIDEKTNTNQLELTKESISQTMNSVLSFFTQRSKIRPLL